MTRVVPIEAVADLALTGERAPQQKTQPQRGSVPLQDRGTKDNFYGAKPMLIGLSAVVLKAEVSHKALKRP